MSIEEDQLKAAIKQAQELRKAEVEMAEKLESEAAKASGKLLEARARAEEKWLKAELKAAVKLQNAQRKAAERWWRKYWSKRGIKINLLATAQDEEELRQNKPVKRVFWMASLGVSLVIAWMLKLQLDVNLARSDYGIIEKQYNDIGAKYAGAHGNLRKFDETDQKLAALDRLPASRFLWAPVLLAMENVKVNGVHITRIAGDQTCKTVDSGVTVERVTLTIRGRDTSANQEGLVKYETNINSCEYFVKDLQCRDCFNLTATLRPALADKSDPSSQFVLFVLVSHFPEMRHEE
jgi:hypothetical protein